MGSKGSTGSLPGRWSPAGDEPGEALAIVAGVALDGLEWLTGAEALPQAADRTPTSVTIASRTIT